MPKKDKKIYLCQNCGNEFATWSGRCEACGEWDSLKEMTVRDTKLVSRARDLTMIDLNSIELKDSERTSTGSVEFDRVLGGGIVQGSIILLGGEPGIGKSTLMLQAAANIDDVIYLSAEESASQIKIRAERLGINSSKIKIISSGDLEAIEKEFLKAKPKLLIVDSVQTVYLNSYPSTPGSVMQVRECGIFLQRLAKSSGIPILLIGHVTKEGNIAGPRILEHLVDAVLYLEGENFQDARILRGIKNRFGATNEVGIFEITDKGLVDILNPSKLFLEQRSNKPGSVVAVALEGNRPLLVEIQALTNVTNFGYPKRTSSGFDLNRLNILAAVITRHTKINCSNLDIYINVVGGLKLKEPAIDLAVCAAIISSYKNKTLDNDLCLFGEVGLSGEVRNVVRTNEREKEAKKLGYRVVTKPKDLNEAILKVFN